MKKIIIYIFLLNTYANANSQTAFRDNFIGKYECLVKLQSPTQTQYQNRTLYVSIDPVYPNRIILTDSLWNPSRLILPVNLYSDSTYRDTIWSFSGGLYNGRFHHLDSIYFHRAVPGGPGGGGLMEYWGKKQPGAVGINENELETNIIISPNPASQLLSVKPRDGFEIEACRLFTVSGKEILMSEKEKDTYDVSSLAKGIYFLQVKSSKAILTKKIIIDN